jgi:PAS domain S-box-containing protein
VNLEIFDNITESVLVSDLNGVITYANNAASNLFGISIKKIQKKRLPNIISQELFKKIMSDNNKNQRIETSLETEPGKNSIVQISATRFDSENNTDSRWIIFFTDLTLENNLHDKYKKELSNVKSIKANLEKFTFALLFLITGFQFIAIQYSLKSIPPLLLTGARFLIAGSILTVFFLKDLRAIVQNIDVKNLLLSTLIYRVLGLGGLAWSIQTVPSGLSSVIFASSALWIYIFSIFLKSEKLNINIFTGISFGIIGTFVIGFANISGVNLNIGYLVLFFSTIVYSYGIILRDNKIPASIISIEMTFAGIFLIIAATFFENINLELLHSLPKETILSFLYLVIFVSLISEPALAWLMTQTTAAKANSFVFVRPLVALSVGFLINSEKLTAIMAIGVAMTLFSLYLIFQKPKLN